MKNLWLPGPRVRPLITSRRAVLTGAGGVAIALPWLESLSSSTASAAAPDGRYAVFVRQANGVSQADNGEAEGFWPYATGSLSTSGLASQTDRALSVLAPWASRLLPVRGVSYAFDSNGCGHSGGGNQVLTAAQVSEKPDGAASLGMGESIDNFIARHHPEHNGGEPLTLYTGPRYGYLEEVLSYRGAMDLRAAEDDPYNAYIRMIGGDGGYDPNVEARRKAVNDLVLDQLNGLLANPKLSASDKVRLDTHFQAVREFETLTCLLSEDEEQAMALASGQGTLNDNRVQFAQWHMDLIALAFACDFVRAATLQIGDGNDATEYTIDGVRLPSYHFISHRIYGDGDVGDPIDGAWEMHRSIDMLFASMFDHLLTRLDEHGVLDRSVACWCSDLGAGVSHSFSNVPYILAGECGGALRTGQYVDVGYEYNNRLFNTIATAVGIEDPDGGPVTDFGDSSLPGGVLSQLLA